MSVHDNPIPPNPASFTRWKIAVYQPNVLPVFYYEHCVNLNLSANQRGVSFITGDGVIVRTSLPFFAIEEE